MMKRHLERAMKDAYWQMLGACEVEADNYDDRLLKFQVEGWYKLWNELTGDEHKPRWITRGEAQ